MVALLSHLGLTAPSLPPVWLPGALRHMHTHAFTHTHTAHSSMPTRPLTCTHTEPCCSRGPSALSSQEGPHLHQHPEAPCVLSSPEGRSPLLGVNPPPWGSSPTQPPWSLSRALSKPACPGPTARPTWTLHFLLDCLLSSLGAEAQWGGGGLALSNPQKPDARILPHEVCLQRARSQRASQVLHVSGRSQGAVRGAVQGGVRGVCPGVSSGSLRWTVSLLYPQRAVVGRQEGFSQVQGLAWGARVGLELGLLPREGQKSLCRAPRWLAHS